jgi:adenylosuccinate lyase
MAESTQNPQPKLVELYAHGNPQYDTYQTSLTTRYCSAAMLYLFSQRSRHSTWRKLWFHLAESQRALGVGSITQQALDEMHAHLEVTDADFDIARVEEKRRRHVGRRFRFVCNVL